MLLFPFQGLRDHALLILAQAPTTCVTSGPASALRKLMLWDSRVQETERFMNSISETIPVLRVSTYLDRFLQIVQTINVALAENIDIEPKVGDVNAPFRPSLFGWPYLNFGDLLVHGNAYGLVIGQSTQRYGGIADEVGSRHLANIFKVEGDSLELKKFEVIGDSLGGWCVVGNRRSEGADNLLPHHRGLFLNFTECVLGGFSRLLVGTKYTSGKERIDDQDSDSKKFRPKFYFVTPILFSLAGYLIAVWGWWNLYWRNPCGWRELRCGLALIGGFWVSVIGGFMLFSRIF
jgi:hypothetical protein